MRTLVVLLALDLSLAAQTALWAPTHIPTPGTICSAILATDTARGRVVLLRYAGASATPQTWEWDGRGWALHAPAKSPPARGGYALVYDSARARVVMFGGADYAGVSLDDTWEWDGIDWSLRSTTSKPSPRASYAMAYDPLRQRTVLFGGISGRIVYDDTWEWDGTAWALRAGSGGPPPRLLAGMAYDPVQQRVVLLGGFFPFSSLGDAWTWDGVTWQPLTVSLPAARFLHGMATDPVRQRIVVHGGSLFDPTGPSGRDTWEWDGSAWTQHASLLPRSGGGLAFDPATQTMLLVGGWYPPFADYGDTWTYDGTSWRQRSSQPTPGHVYLTYDANRNVVLAIGTAFMPGTWVGCREG